MLQVLHHDVQVDIVFERLHILDNVWVVKHGKNGDLSVDKLDDLRVQVRLEHDLHSILHLRVVP